MESNAAKDLTIETSTSSELVNKNGNGNVQNEDKSYIFLYYRL